MKQVTLALTMFLSLLASQAQASAQLNVAEANSYTLAYSLAIPNAAQFNSNPIPYTVDNHSSIATGSFSRIAYYMELQNSSGGPLMFAYASMDAFTSNAGLIGVPSAATGAFFQQNVNNMNVVSNVAGITNGTGIATGNLEFWHFNYVTDNAVSVPGANNRNYDFGDRATFDANYGSMQIHNYGAGQTILDFNNWGSNGGDVDIGLGNNANGHPDWTFAHNGGQYAVKNLEVLVLTHAVPEPSSIALLGLGLLGFAAMRRKSKK